MHRAFVFILTFACAPMTTDKDAVVDATDVSDVSDPATDAVDVTDATDVTDPVTDVPGPVACDVATMVTVMHATPTSPPRGM